MSEYEATWQMWVTFAIIVSAIAAYTSERIPVEITSIIALGTLLVFFHFFPVTNAAGDSLITAEALLAGFGNPALIAILALLIVGQGIFQTGAFERPTQWLLRGDDQHTTLKVVGVLVLVMIISAFLNNTPVVVMFVPVIGALAAHANRSAGSVMMPLSFVSVLGGMTTLIGSSTNLLTADAYAKITGDTIGFFDFTPIGIALAATGLIYVLVVGPFLLPKEDQPTDKQEVMGGKHFLAQIELTPGHPLVGATSTAGMFPDLPRMTVRMIYRQNETLLPPFDDFTLEVGDTLVIAATRKTLTTFLTKHLDYIETFASVPRPASDSMQSTTSDLTMIEAVIAPGSRMINRPLFQLGFYFLTNCSILGVQRRSRMVRTRLNEIRLEAGDVLLLFGTREDIMTLRAHRDLIALEWSSADLPNVTHTKRAAFIFGTMVIAAATGILPITIAAVAGAALMVATGCLNIRQAVRAVDQRIFLLIAGALALGVALERTGGASYLASTLVSGLEQASVPLVMSAFFLLVALLTNVLSNNATAVIMTPIAISTATQLGVSPLVFVYTVIFAANCCFATPIAYQTNLLVMAPGHYTFGDFVKAGTPLLVLIWLTFTLIGPWYFGISW